MRSSLASSLASSLLIVLAAAGLVACARPPCELTCKHVAACKREKQAGERLLGEHAPPADPTCMERCEAATPEFAACEGKSRECDAVLACLPYR
jgi:Cys-rich protein (TIGR04453 family)